MLIKNKYIPFGKYKAVALYPFIFYKKDINLIDVNHEKIHLKQQLELLILPFYILYAIFHLIYGYDKNPFEKEAYKYQSDLNYCRNRKFWAWL